MPTTFNGPRGDGPPQAHQPSDRAVWGLQRVSTVAQFGHPRARWSLILAQILKALHLAKSSRIGYITFVMILEKKLGFLSRNGDG